jgi:O-antigen/teichoic acid export membrane protein
VKIFKTVGVVFLLNILEYLLAPISVILVVKKLSVVDFGFYGLLSTVLGLSATLFGLGLNLYNFKNIPGKPAEEQYRILKTTLGLQLAASVGGAVLISVVLRKDLIEYGLIVLFSLKIVITVINGEFLRFLGLQKKITAKSIIGFVDSKLWLFALFVFFLFGNVSVRNIYISQVLGSILTVVVILLLMDRKLLLGSGLDKSVALDALKYSLPLIIIDIGQYLLEMGDRYIIKVFCDYTQLGYYTFAYNWIRIILKFGMLLLYVMQPYISESYNMMKEKGDFHSQRFYSFFRISIKYSLTILISGLVFFLANFSQIVMVVGRPEYQNTISTAIFLGFFPVFMFLSYFAHIVSVLQGKIKQVTICYLVAAGFNVVLNIVLIGRMGINGAALSTVITYVLLFLFILRSIDVDFAAFGFGNAEGLRLLLFLSLFALMNILGNKIEMNLFIRFMVYSAVYTGLFFAIRIADRKDIHILKSIG